MKEQFAFLQDVIKLLQFIISQGFEVTFGEVARTPEQQKIYLATGRTKTLDSDHLKRRAIDLNFFKDGQLIYNFDAIKPIGDYWESLHPGNRWGGNFKSLKDLPHFEAPHVIPVSNVGAVGVVQDVPEHELPLNVWTAAKNIRFKDGAAGKFPGHAETYASPLFAPYGCSRLRQEVLITGSMRGWRKWVRLTARRTLTSRGQPEVITRLTFLSAGRAQSSTTCQLSTTASIYRRCGARWDLGFR